MTKIDDDEVYVVVGTDGYHKLHHWATLL